jgi:hypothetical protein
MAIRAQAYLPNPVSARSWTDGGCLGDGRQVSEFAESEPTNNVKD